MKNMEEEYNENGSGATTSTGTSTAVPSKPSFFLEENLSLYHHFRFGYFMYA